MLRRGGTLGGRTAERNSLTFFGQVSGGEVGVLASTSRSAKGARWKCIPRVRVEATRHQRAARDAREEAHGVGASVVLRQRNWRAANLVARTVSRARGMSSQKRPGGPAGAGPSKRQNMAEDEDEDMGFDEEEMLAMEEEMADEAGQEDGPAPPDEEVASCLTKTQFAACAKQWTRPKVPPLDPATDEVTFQQSEVCRRRCRRQHRPSPPPPSPPPPSRPPPSLPPPQASR